MERGRRENGYVVRVRPIALSDRSMQMKTIKISNVFLVNTDLASYHQRLDAMYAIFVCCFYVICFFCMCVAAWTCSRPSIVCMRIEWQNITYHSMEYRPTVGQYLYTTLSVDAHHIFVEVIESEINLSILLWWVKCRRRLHHDIEYFMCVCMCATAVMNTISRPIEEYRTTREG